MSADEEAERTRQEYLERVRLKHDAYVQLFGTAGHPTPLGQVVLEDLDRFCRRGEESIHMDEQGRMDPYTTIYRDGKKAVADRIHAMIEWSDHDNSSSGSNGQ